MRHLCNILEKIDAGSEAVIREQLDLALGVWSAHKGASHKIIAVSESSVAFADGEANLFVAHYTISEGRVALTDCRRLMNISEEANNTSFLDEIAAKFVDLVAEDQEDEASKLIGMVMEMKTKAVGAVKMVEQKEGAASRARYLKESTAARWRLIQEAKKSAKTLVFKKASALRKKIHEGKEIGKKLAPLLEAAVAMMATLDLSKRDPLIEGFIVEKNELGVPTVMRPKGAAVLVSIAEEEDGDDKPAFLKDKEDDKDGEKKDDDKKDDKDDKKDKGEKKDDDKEEKKDGEDKKDDKEEKKTDEGIVVVNLKTIKETLDPKKDFYYRAAVAWKSFRADPVTEETAALIKNQSTAAAIVEHAPFLALLTEDEVYEAIAPHIDAFDPADIRTVAKAIVAEGETKDGKAAKDKFLVSIGDNEISEAIKSQKLPISTQLDHLFLEAEDFDFGAADDLGSDDLNDDKSTEGMTDADGEGEDDLGGDEDLTSMDDEGGDDEGEQISFSMSADRAREMLKKVLDVVGDEIEDSDEFNDLKAKVDGTADGEGGEQPELTGDDISSMLQVIGDYFDAVGKDKTDQDEANAEDEMGDENLDDMSTIGDKGGDEAGAEGDQGVPGGQPAPAGAEDDLSLGQ
jgi:hypothetical protein